MAIPAAEAGLVVHFNYLWRRESDDGLEEARYPRPCAVVVSYRRGTDGTLIAILAAITHSEPRQGDESIEIPRRVKAHLGLDSERSWVIVSEVNETAWPGFDLLPNAAGDYAYGFMPPKLHARIRAAIVALAQAGDLAVVRR